MKKTITNVEQFKTEFIKMNRTEQFSQDGLEVLYEWLTELDMETGEETELDVIALCCEFTEYKGIEELKENYTEIKNIQDLLDKTHVIFIDNIYDVEDGNGRFIIQDF